MRPTSSNKEGWKNRSSSSQRSKTSRRSSLSEGELHSASPGRPSRTCAMMTHLHAGLMTPLISSAARLFNKSGGVCDNLGSVLGRSIVDCAADSKVRVCIRAPPSTTTYICLVGGDHDGVFSVTLLEMAPLASRLSFTLMMKKKMTMIMMNIMSSWTTRRDMRRDWNHRAWSQRWPWPGAEVLTGAAGKNRGGGQSGCRQDVTLFFSLC